MNQFYQISIRFRSVVPVEIRYVIYHMHNISEILIFWLSHDAFRVIIRPSIYRVHIYMYVYENVMIFELFCFILFYTIEVSFPFYTMAKKKDKAFSAS